MIFPILNALWFLFLVFEELVLNVLNLSLKWKKNTHLNCFCSLFSHKASLLKLISVPNVSSN